MVLKRSAISTLTVGIIFKIVSTSTIHLTSVGSGLIEEKSIGRWMDKVDKDKMYARGRPD